MSFRTGFEQMKAEQTHEETYIVMTNRSSEAMRATEPPERDASAAAKAELERLAAAHESHGKLLLAVAANQRRAAAALELRR